MMVAGIALVSASVAIPSTVNAEGYPTTDGQFSGTGPIGPGQTLNLTVLGRGGVPATGVDAVALNVTATGASSDSYLTVWPTGSPRPTASNLNFSAGQTVPNMVVAKVGTSGQASIFNLAGSVDVVVDVLGWFPSGGSFVGLSPARVLETRPGLPTTDGIAAGGGPVTAGEVRTVAVTGRGGVPASGVGAVAVNVTATNPTASSYVTVWPSGEQRPTASNLNVTAGQTVPNMAIVKVGADGRIALFNLAGSVDLIVDVLGWFPTGTTYTGLVPARLADSRPGQPTVDGAFSGTGQVGSGSTLNVTVAGRGGVPAAGVGSVAVNVTVTAPTAGSYLTVWPAGATRPTASNLNFVTGQTVPNMVIAKVGASGQISLFNFAGATDVIVDVLGWFPTTGSYQGLTPARLADTRVLPPPPPPVVLTFQPGTHAVNTVIPPGRYIAQAKLGCYWERSSGFGGTLGEIIANDFRSYTGPVIVDVLASDAGFKFDRECGPMRTYSAPAQASTVITPGSHVVGSDIAPGTYIAQAKSGCYWERTRAFTGRLADLIANDFMGSGGPAVVTISATDVGFTSDADCGTWSRV
jgi:hypothetical protein